MRPIERKMLKKDKNEQALDSAIERVLNDMDTYGPDSEEYKQLVEHLEKLYSLKNTRTTKRVSPDTIAIVAGNLLGILIIVAYEQKNVITSKGIGFVMKTR